MAREHHGWVLRHLAQSFAMFGLLGLVACGPEAPAGPTVQETAREHAANGCRIALNGGGAEEVLDELAMAARDDPAWSALYDAMSEGLSGTLDLSGIPAEPDGDDAGGWSVYRESLDETNRYGERATQLGRIIASECRKATVE